MRGPFPAWPCRASRTCMGRVGSRLNGTYTPSRLSTGAPGWAGASVVGTLSTGWEGARAARHVLAAAIRSAQARSPHTPTPDTIARVALRLEEARPISCQRNLSGRGVVYARATTAALLRASVPLWARAVPHGIHVLSVARGWIMREVLPARRPPVRRPGRPRAAGRRRGSDRARAAAPPRP